MSEYGLFTGHEILEAKDDREPVIDKILDIGDRCVIAAKKKQGKTVLVFQIICCLTTGEPFLGIYKVYKPCSVLYMQGEMPKHETGRRLNNMKKKVPLNADNLMVYNVRGAALQTSNGCNEVLQDIRKCGKTFDVVVIDPLYRFIHGGNINSVQDVTTWVNNVDLLIDKLGAHTAIMIHHDSEKSAMDKNGNKHEAAEDTLFGSSIWGAFITQAYKLYKYNGIHTLKNPEGFQRSGENIDKITMKMVVPKHDKEGRLFYEPYEAEESKSMSDKLINKLMSEKECVYPDIYESLSMSPSYFHKVIAEHEKTGKVVKSKDDNGKVIYKWNS